MHLRLDPGDHDKIAEVARKELEGVRRADVLIVLLPGGRGTHVELGIALARDKPILLWAPREHAEALFGTSRATCAFYHLVEWVTSDSAAESARMYLRAAAASAYPGA